MERHLENAGVDYEVKVLSAHRNLEELLDFLKKHSGEYGTVIASAGYSASLPGLVAAISEVPVLGVPISSSPVRLDALFSMIEMPKGVPLAVCSYDKAGLINASLLALKICGEKEKFETLKKDIYK